MGIFRKKQEVGLEEFCSDFYEKNILNPIIEGIDAGAVFVDTIKRNIVEADNNFAKIDSKNFTNEIVLLRFELFALAWLHQFGDKSAVAQSVFTKHYLHEKGRDDVWNNSKPYNQAIARSSTLGKTPKKAFDRAFLGYRNMTIADLFGQYYARGYDPECVGRVLNRLFTDTPWKKGVTAGLLMFALCDRLGFEPNFEPTKEAQFRLTAIIHGFYDGAKQALEKVKIKQIKQIKQKEITLLKDSEWAKIDGEVCRVIDFKPLAIVKNNKIRRVGVMPYASITFECKKVPQKITGFINHREDFQHLWTAFKERRIRNNEEVLIIWSRNHYTFKWLRVFAFLLPKLRVMICPKGAYELITDDKWKPELTGEARAKASIPILDLKSKIME